MSAAKAMIDLEQLVRALLSSLPASKPWQRQLRLHLVEADRLLQALRMTISLNCDESALAEAAAKLLQALEAANAYVAAGKTDMGTKYAVQLGFRLGQQVVAGVAANAVS